MIDCLLPIIFVLVYVQGKLQVLKAYSTAYFKYFHYLCVHFSQWNLIKLIKNVWKPKICQSSVHSSVPVQ